MEGAKKRIIALFDVDQTLTPARNTIQKNMIDTLDAIIARGVAVGIVSGSDLVKVREQVGDELIQKADFTFSENGLYTLKKGQFFNQRSIKDELGEEKLKRFINFCLKYMSELDIPIKRYINC